MDKNLTIHMSNESLRQGLYKKLEGYATLFDGECAHPSLCSFSRLVLSYPQERLPTEKLDRGMNVSDQVGRSLSKIPRKVGNISSIDLRVVTA